jgi:hypothetical protein
MLVTLLNPPLEQLLRTLPIPLFDQRTDLIGAARSRRAYMQITAHQFHGVAVSHVELKSVLSTEENVALPAYVPPFRSNRRSLAKVLQLPRDPRRTTPNPCIDLGQALACRCSHFYC